MPSTEKRRGESLESERTQPIPEKGPNRPRPIAADISAGIPVGRNRNEGRRTELLCDATEGEDGQRVVLLGDVFFLVLVLVSIFVLILVAQFVATLMFCVYFG